MDDDATLRDFAASEWNHVSAPPERYHPVLVRAPLLRRVSAWLIDWAVILLVGGPVAGFATGVLAFWVFAGDFDALLLRMALDSWFFPAAWALLAVAYTYVEALGRVTLGKRLLRLRIVDVGGPPPGQRWRFLLRWVLARTPLVAVAVVYGGMAAGPATVEWSDFEADLWYLQVALLGTYALHWLVGVTCVPAPGRITLWEWISGVELRHDLPLTYQSLKRGFEVVPADTEAPVV